MKVFKYTEDERYCLKQCVREIEEADQYISKIKKQTEDLEENGWYMEAQFRLCAMLTFQERIIEMCEVNEFSLEIAVRMVQLCFKSSYAETKGFLKDFFNEDEQAYLFSDSKWYQ